MAVTAYGTNYTNAYQTTPPTLIDYGKYRGRVRAIFDTYVTNGVSETSGSQIVMGKLPKNATFLGGWIATTSLGSAATLSVGYSGSTAVLASAASGAHAGPATTTLVLASGSIGYNPSSEQDIYVSALGVTWQSNATVSMTVFYAAP